MSYRLDEHLLKLTDRRGRITEAEAARCLGFLSQGTLKYHMFTAQKELAAAGLLPTISEKGGYHQHRMYPRSIHEWWRAAEPICRVVGRAALTARRVQISVEHDEISAFFRLYNKHKKQEVCVRLDEDDVHFVNDWPAAWHVNFEGYIMAKSKTCPCAYLHRVIMEVDHIDGNPANNRKCNLRIVNDQEQGQNVKHLGETGIRGVYWERAHRSFRVYVNGTFHGLFTSSEEAYKAATTGRAQAFTHANEVRHTPTVEQFAKLDAECLQNRAKNHMLHIRKTSNDALSEREAGRIFCGKAYYFYGLRKHMKNLGLPDTDFPPATSNASGNRSWRMYPNTFAELAIISENAKAHIANYTRSLP
jgi:hypothetical protein